MDFALLACGLIPKAGFPFGSVAAGLSQAEPVLGLAALMLGHSRRGMWFEV